MTLKQTPAMSHFKSRLHNGTSGMPGLPAAGERIQNHPDVDEDKSLDITYFCTNEDENKLRVVWELHPVEPPASRYGIAGKDPVPRVPMRLVVVIDTSHSMAEPCTSSKGGGGMGGGGGEADAEGTEVTKLDKVKMFAKLLVQTMSLEDYLGIVTFGTKAQAVFPLRRMTPDIKENAFKVIDSIEVGGVTHLSAGLFLGIEQFVLDFNMLSQSLLELCDENNKVEKIRQFDDNLILFTDGMANEGVMDSKTMNREIKRRINELKKEYNYDSDYGIKLSTIGTSGFLPELIYDVGRAFSSDAYYYLDDAHVMEVQLFRPVLLRQTAVCYNVHVQLTTMNGVKFDTRDMVSEFQPYEPDEEGVVSTSITETSASYVIHDLAAELDRHLVVTLVLPPKHKKLLKDKSVMRLDVTYKDVRLGVHSKVETVPYSMVPRKPKFNTERETIVVAQHQNRVCAVRALERATRAMKRLDRNSAKHVLQDAVNTIKERCDTLSAGLASEESYAMLTQYTDPILANLNYCESYLGDFCVRWDDAWARLKGLQSSLSREAPSSQAVYAEGHEMYNSKRVQEKMNGVCYKLKELYRARGLDMSMLDAYHDVILELTQKWQLEAHQPESEPITLFGHFTINP